MTPILSSLLDAIDTAKATYPKHADFPKLVGAAIVLINGADERLHEWISMLEDPNTPMKEIFAVTAKWDDSTEESVAYYIEIADQLKAGLYIAIDSMGY